MMRVLFILSLCILIGCKEKQTKVDATRIIVNQTSVDVVVEIFGSTDFENTIYNVNIGSGDSAVIEGYCLHGLDGGCVIGWDDDIARSGRIIFNSERVQAEVYDGDCSEKKIIYQVNLSCGYTQRYDESGEKILTYTITEADYENAEPIDN